MTVDDLFDYQRKGAEQLSVKFFEEKKAAIVLTMATGSGKSYLYTYIAQKMIEAGKVVLVLTDRVELNDQGSDSLEAFGIEPEKIIAGKKGIDYSAMCYVAMTQTLDKRLNADPKLVEKLRVDMVIVDEVHRSIHNKVVEKFVDSASYFLGLTATPESTNKKKPLNDFYEDIVVPIEISELIKRKRLLPSRHFAAKVNIDFSQLRKSATSGDFTEESMNKEYMKEEVYRNVVSHYKNHCNNAKTIVFNCSVIHSQAMTEAFRKAGYRSEHIDGKTPKGERRSLLLRLKIGDIDVLNSVSTLTTGLDIPALECCILNRAVGVLSLYYQMIGRAARTYGDLEHFYILDFGRNYHRHGAFEDSVDWVGIFNGKPRDIEPGDAPTKQCEGCGLICPASATVCPECYTPFPIPEKAPLKIAVLKEMPKKGVWPVRLQNRKNYTVEELIEVAIIKGNKQSSVPYLFGGSLDKLHEFAKLTGKGDNWVNSTIKYSKGMAKIEWK